MKLGRRLHQDDYMPIRSQVISRQNVCRHVAAVASQLTKSQGWGEKLTSVENNACNTLHLDNHLCDTVREGGVAWQPLSHTCKFKKSHSRGTCILEDFAPTQKIYSLTLQAAMYTPVSNTRHVCVTHLQHNHTSRGQVA